MRLGNPSLMPTAEKRLIECFVSTTDTQILQSIFDLTVGKTEHSELSMYVHTRTLLDSCTEQFTVVYRNISHMHSVYQSLSLLFGRCLGTRLLTCIYIMYSGVNQHRVLPLVSFPYTVHSLNTHCNNNFDVLVDITFLSTVIVHILFA